MCLHHLKISVAEPILIFFDSLFKVFLKIYFYFYICLLRPLQLQLQLQPYYLTLVQSIFIKQTILAPAPDPQNNFGSGPATLLKDSFWSQADWSEPWGELSVPSQRSALNPPASPYTVNTSITHTYSYSRQIIYPYTLLHSTAFLIPS